MGQATSTLRSSGAVSTGGIWNVLGPVTIMQPVTNSNSINGTFIYFKMIALMDFSPMYTSVSASPFQHWYFTLSEYCLSACRLPLKHLAIESVSYTHLRAHETREDRVWGLMD